MGAAEATDVESEYSSLVDFEGPDDPSHPFNWSLPRRVWTTAVVAVLNLIGTAASSIFETGNGQFMKEFGISHEVAVLGTSLFLAGYILGFLTFGPLSERFGRKWPLLCGLAVSSLFDLMPALGHSLPAILIGRFFGGLFGVAPVAVFGGVLSDCWPTAQRGIAMALTVSLVFSGPTWGPVFGGFIMGSSALDWRWNMWVVIIAGLSATALCVVVFPETYPPAILRRKARRLRKKTGDESIRTASDKEGLSLQEITRVYLIRPFWLFTTQPILALLTLYQSFVYGVLFLFYQTYPVAFGTNRGWATSLEYLPLLAIIVGIFVAAIGIVIHNQLYFRHHCHTPDGVFIPESRLPPMIVGGILVPIGMFWFAWTATPAVAWASPICASVVIGAGMYLLFIQGFNYIVDCYTTMANSAMGVNGSMRSIFGTVFPLFATQMVHALGVARTTTILGALSAALVPVPICFWYWGDRIRAWSSAKVATF
ncbi:hypothetical protein ASPZODRAFT_159273 [Penicilliopsis zonata CBS 506.65]|uniref:Major facilitator superfamily (MFS) profile domain-containing protein n=1 Tax=Penicilliopsis zonata CBS 506.65 TaxID=1073090 RepID=A0A1L9SJW4_9EURO|nr:hypothetical protein ASPZODRAFT_159273 [Penicilliopsis zonata CBS 506.65]OJJ47393.1 hypothetical protein ASPZODRAFT_159273 [Penicilliopsis zonata CBS 506.65]